MKPNDELEILSAFLDGEEVEPEALVRALSTPSAREALADFALLRAEVRDDDSRPSAAFYAAMERTLARETRAAWWRAVLPIPAPALAAASLALAALLLWVGIGIGEGRAPDADAPPQPARVFHFEPGVDWHSRG